MYEDRDRDGVSNQAPDEPAQAEPEAPQLHVTCPQCKAGPGVKCHNYKGKNCATHRERNKIAAETQAEDAHCAANQD